MTLARYGSLAVALAATIGGLAVAPQPPQWWRFLLAVGVACSAHLLRQQVRVKMSVFYLAWGEAALIIALFLVPPGYIPLVIATGVLIPTGLRSLWQRQWPSASVPEVTSCLVIAAAAGALVGCAVIDPYQAALSPAVAVALVLAGATYLVVSTVGVHLMAAGRQGVPVLSLLRRTQRYKLPMSLTSILVGVITVVIASVDLRWIVLLPVLLWLLNRAGAYRIRGGERRRMWAALAAATRSLNRPDEPSVAAAGARGALEVFAVGRAAVTLPSGNGVPRAWVAGPDGRVRQRHGLPDDGTATVVPLLAGGDEIGQLRVRFPSQAGPGDGEHAALQAYADALAAALHDTATHQELHKLLERSAHDAQHDPLTGLLNRAALLARGETVIQLLPHGSPVALLMVDLAHFREINDTLGHAAGDQVLKVTAAKLRRQAGTGELLGRLGGDEFAILVAGASGADLAETRRAAMARGSQLAALLAAPVDVNGVPVSVEASVSVVVAPAGTADMTELLRRVAAAMDQAKRSAGAVGCYAALADSGSSDRPALLAELREALSRDDELVLALQPVVALDTGAPLAVEALVRWRHPQRGTLLPAVFLRTVENSDLLGMFTEYLLDRALAAAAGWAETGPPVPVAVNLSARSLLDRQLPRVVSRLLSKHRLPGSRLVAEVAETVVGSGLPGVDAALRALRGLGVRLSVDDFGSGYASLTSLTRIPLDEVKLDGRFITKLDSSAEAAAIVRTTIELGRELGLRVVAESVETAAQHEQLRQLGCPAGQGYQLAPPVPAEQIGELLRDLPAADLELVRSAEHHSG